ncbi:MAG: acetoin dehydrogenase dihydrolipoyllysine-residue acetyltransferase subunit [Alphaproteobacteria bacterium]|nr:acetoin dehydrogenase dihydrolipoyllysine-residue acetyltransferase subunit [Alphaproteobacteria bacterium]
MSDEIRKLTMPKWGLQMQEGTVVEWLAPEGSDIAQGEEIVEVETEKVNNAYEAPFPGRLRRHVAAVGQTVPVGGLIAVVAPESVSDAQIDAFVAGFDADFVPEADEGETATPQTVTIDGRDINYLDIGTGDGAPLVLVHGLCADLNGWMFNHPVLAAGRRVVALDLPGHGASSKDVGDGDVAFFADTLANFLAELDIGRAHLVGHSMGGAISIAFALDNRDRVRSLSLIAPAGLAGDINGGFLAEMIGAEKRRGARLALSQLVDDADLVSRDMIEQFLRYKRTDGVPEALAVIAAANFDGDTQKTVLADRLGAIDIPVMCIWGDKDQVIPPAHSDKLPAGATVHRFENVGHLPQMEKAAQVNALLAEFANESE